MGSSESKPRNLEDLESAEYDEEEFMSWCKGFKAKYPTGELTLQDVQQGYSERFPLGYPDEFAKHIFGVFGKPENGVIHFTEFMVAICLTVARGLESRLRWAFRMYDVDNEGGVTLEEILSLIGTVYMVRGNTLPRLAGDALTPEQRVRDIYKKDSDGEKELVAEGAKKLKVEAFIEGAKRDPYLVLMVEPPANKSGSDGGSDGETKAEADAAEEKEVDLEDDEREVLEGDASNLKTEDCSGAEGKPGDEEANGVEEKSGEVKGSDCVEKSEENEDEGSDEKSRVAEAKSVDGDAKAEDLTDPSETKE